ncbi:MAG: polysaccharide biosynthesis protein [Clostridium sp.]|nr:polysaccharide biosynthesis protein [Clostridium sp.]MCI7442041.1 polysaccharide biosynthesis protein [Clostridium sp.]
MKKQSLIKGSLILGIAGMLTRFLGIFFRWPLFMLIGDEGVGYYQMVYPLYMFFIAMASGIPIAMSKMISESNAISDIKTSFQVVKESAILTIFIGTGTSLILFLFSKQIINFLNWDYKAYYSLIGISFAPMIISFVTVLRGFFQGFQNMTPSAISQILEQIGRVVFGVGLAYILLEKGIEFSAGAASFGATAGGILAGLFLYFQYRKTKKSFKIIKVKSNPDILTKILKISIPISLGATVGTIMSLIDSILVPQKLLQAGFNKTQSTILYAQLTGKASVIVNIPLTLSIALCTSLIPIIAESYVLKRREEIKSKVNLSIKMSAVIAIPCMFGLFFMAEPIMRFILPGRSEGGNILKYLSLSIPFIIITQTTTSILQSVGSYIIPIINLLIGCILKIILTIVLVPISYINIYGAVIASVSAYVIVAILNVIAMKKKLGLKLNPYENFVKPSYASIFMIIGVLLSYSYLFKNTSSNGVSCLLSILLGVIIYTMGIIILKIFNIKNDKKIIKRAKKPLKKT